MVFDLWVFEDSVLQLFSNFFVSLFLFEEVVGEQVDSFFLIFLTILEVEELRVEVFSDVEEVMIVILYIVGVLNVEVMFDEVLEDEDRDANDFHILVSVRDVDDGDIILEGEDEVFSAVEEVSIAATDEEGCVNFVK